MCNKPVRQPSAQTLLSRPKPDTETRDKVIATLFAHSGQVSTNTTVRRLESKIKYCFLGLALRADPSLSSAR